MEKVDLRYTNPTRWTLFGPRISQTRAHIILPMLVERGKRKKDNSVWRIGK